jgi:hypothetical protein
LISSAEESHLSKTSSDEMIGKNFKEIYEFKTQNTISPKNISLKDYIKFKNKSLREARDPSVVGSIYAPLVRKSKFDTPNTNLSFEDYPGADGFEEMYSGGGGMGWDIEKAKRNNVVYKGKIENVYINYINLCDWLQRKRRHRV